jgi:hypothetical protein
LQEHPPKPKNKHAVQMAIFGNEMDLKKSIDTIADLIDVKKKYIFCIKK